MAPGVPDKRYHCPVARRTPRPRSPDLKLAGKLCVAFVNTAGARPDNRQLGVSNFSEFVTWSREIGIVSAHDSERLRQQAAQRPVEAEAAFGRAATIRAGLAQSFLDTQWQKPVAESTLEILNRALAETSITPRLVAAKTGASWVWAGEEDTLDSLLAPILGSAYDVMVAADGRPHVRQCAAERCQRFFFDPSPTGHRKWCDKATCGHRGTNLRYYHRRGKRLQVRF